MLISRTTELTHADKMPMSAPDVTDSPEAMPALGAVSLLERAIVELIARRGSAEIEARNCRLDERESDAREWMCRAAGLAEAIAVLQLFSDAARSNS